MMAAWKSYALAPLDTLFLRDGRPFSAGEGTDAFSQFPPTPFSVNGLVRSKLMGTGCKFWHLYKDGCRDRLKQHPCELNGKCQGQDVLGVLRDENTPSGLQVRASGLHIGQTPVLPVPMDLVALNSDMKAVLQRDTQCLPTGLLRPKEGQPPSNMPGNLSPLSPPPHWKDEPFEGVLGWIAWARFAEYLAGNAPVLCRGTDWWRREDVAQTELRPGLKIEDGRNRAQEGQLYFARHIRLDDRENGRIALSLEVDGAGPLETALLDPPMSPFGGERRAVVLRPADDPPWRTVPPSIRQAIASSGHVSVVFIQIAWFRGGWIPDGWSAGDAAKPATALIKPLGKADITCTWRAARLERPETIGGWDLARGDQKPVRRFVPRGAVYYLEVQDTNDRQAVFDLWNSCVTDTPKEEPFEPFSYDRMGLGHILLGTW